MDSLYGLFLAICIAAVVAAGCTTVSQGPVTVTPTPFAGERIVPPSSQGPVSTPACTNDTCSFLPPATLPAPATSLSIETSPKRYSPIMSSTPGIGLLPKTTGFNASAAVFSWNTSYGQFLSWNAPDYAVNQQGAVTTNKGEKLYWSFTDRPVSADTPVTITVVAKDKSTGTVLGSSAVTLAWDDGNYTVTVQDSL